MRVFSKCVHQIPIWWEKEEVENRERTLKITSSMAWLASEVQKEENNNNFINAAAGLGRRREKYVIDKVISSKKEMAEKTQIENRLTFKCSA